MSTISSFLHLRTYSHIIPDTHVSSLTLHSSVTTLIITIVRLDQYVSQGLTISRKQAKRLISQGRIFVDGKPLKKANRQLNNIDTVSFQNKNLAPAIEQYIMLHKPAGYCCSHEDDGYPSALTLLNLNTAHKKLHFAGRLDADTTGLVLLSSDGMWCHRITSPKQHTRKQKGYRCTLAEPIHDNALDALREGVLLRGEVTQTLPAELTRISDTEVCIFIKEGRYHQIKRMFAAVNNRIIALHRFSIGNIQLNEQLDVGHYRHLSSNEIQEFMHASD